MGKARKKGKIDALREGGGFWYGPLVKGDAADGKSGGGEKIVKRGGSFLKGSLFSLKGGGGQKWGLNWRRQDS